MGKLILSMLIGAIVVMAATDGSRASFRESVHSLALTVAEAVHK